MNTFVVNRTGSFPMYKDDIIPSVQFGSHVWSRSQRDRMSDAKHGAPSSSASSSSAFPPNAQYPLRNMEIVW